MFTNAKVLQELQRCRKLKNSRIQFHKTISEVLPKAQCVKPDTLYKRVEALQRLKTRLSKNKEKEKLSGLLEDEFCPLETFGQLSRGNEKSEDFVSKRSAPNGNVEPASKRPRRTDHTSECEINTQFEELQSTIGFWLMCM